MTNVIYQKSFSPPPVSREEVLRYAQCASPDTRILALLEECLAEVEGKLRFKVCWRILPVRVGEDSCDFGLFEIASRDLARALRGCGQAVLFAATVGIEPDRLIGKYGRLAPTRAVLHQAIGAERIEALCDAFCRELEMQLGEALGSRFSPGYGDLPIQCQETVFDLLDCPRQIGVSLNESLLMLPSKSVTAFVGVGGCVEKRQGCGACGLEECPFRGAL